MRRNQYMDAMKAIACVFVVLIHCMFPGKIGLCFRAVARFAVPLFFMVSGYFLYDTDRLRMSSSIPRKMKRLFWIILFSGIGYLMLEIVKAILSDEGIFVVKEFLLNFFSWELILRLFITNTPLVYMPRWFLYALIYCYLFVLIFSKTRISNKQLYCVSSLLLVGLLGLEYTSVLTGANFGFYIGETEVFVTIRNIFLFRALPWLVLGMGLKEFQSKLEQISIGFYWIMCVIGIIITIFQALLMGDVSVYLGSILIDVGLFGIAIKQQNNSVKGFLTHIGNKLSLYVYILHGAVIDAFTLLEKVIFDGKENLLFAWIKPILVIIVSIAGAQIIFCLSTSIRKKGKSKNE